MSAARQLEVEPSRLEFQFQVGRELTCRLQLKNNGNSSLCVKITASGRHRYRIEPSNSIITAGAGGVVNITCEALKAKPSGFFNDALMVESYLAPAGAEAADQSLGKNVNKVKLPVIFSDNQQSPVAQSGSSYLGIFGKRSSSIGGDESPPVATVVADEVEAVRAGRDREGRRAQQQQQELEAMNGSRSAENGREEEGSPSTSSGGLAEAERQKYEQKIKALVDESDAAKERAAEANKVRRNVTQQMADLKLKYQEDRRAAEEKSQLEISTTKSQNMALTAQLAEMTTLCSEAVRRCETLQAELEEARLEREETAEALQEKNKVMAHLQEALNKRGVQRGVQPEHEDVETLRNELREMREACSIGLQQLEDRQHELEALNEERRAAVESRAEAERELQVVQGKKQRLEADMVGLKRELMESQLLQAPKENVPEELRELRLKLQMLQAEMERKEARYGALMQHQLELKKRIRMLERGGKAEGSIAGPELAEAEQRIAELEALAAERDRTIEALEKEKEARLLEKGIPSESKHAEEEMEDGKEDEMRILKEDLREFKEENDNLVEEVLLLQRDAEQLQSSNKKLLDRLATSTKVKEELESFKRKHDELLAECEQLKEQLEVEGENLQRTQSSGEKQKEVEEVFEREELQREMEILKGHVADLQNALEESEERAKQAKDELESFKETYHEVVAECEYLKQCLEVERGKSQNAKQSEEQLRELERVRESGRERERELRREREALQCRVADLEAALESGEANVSKANHELESFKKKYDEVTEECEHLQQLLEEEEEKSRLLTEQLRELERMREKEGELRRERDSLQASLERSEASVIESEQYIETLRRQSQSLQEQVNTAKTDAQRKAQVQVMEITSDLSAAREQTREVLAQMESLQAQHAIQVESLQASIADLRTQARDAKLSTPEATEELTERVAALEGERRRQESNIARMKEEISRARKDFAEATSARKKAEEDLAAVQEQMDFLELQLESTKQEAQEHSAKVGVLTVQLTAAQRERERAASDAREAARLQQALTQQEAAVQRAQRTLQLRIQEDAKRQQEVAVELATTNNLIQTLQKEAMDALDEKSQVEQAVNALEIVDPYRRGHVLKLRKRPNFTCSACHQVGAGYSWKCADRTCGDIIHPGCAVAVRR